MSNEPVCDTRSGEASPNMKLMHHGGEPFLTPTPTPTPKNAEENSGDEHRVEHPEPLRLTGMDRDSPPLSPKLKGREERKRGMDGVGLGVAGQGSF